MSRCWVAVGAWCQEVGLENGSLVLRPVPKRAGSDRPAVASVSAAGASAVPSLGPDSPGDALYRYCFSSRRLRQRSLAAIAPELKAANNRLDGVFWPRSAGTGIPDQPVVLLEVQMQGKAASVQIKQRRYWSLMRMLCCPADLWHGLPPTPAVGRVFYFAWLDSPSCRVS